MPVVPQMENPGAGRMTFIQRVLGRANVPFFTLLTVLVLFGLVIVWYATASSTEHSFSRQLAGVGLGIVLMIIFWKVDYQAFAQAVVPLLIIDVVLLLSPHLPLIG